MNETKRCESCLEGQQCERQQGHHGKHRNGGVSWTDAGLKRLKEEMWNELTK
jgi:hypothetical protein